MKKAVLDKNTDKQESDKLGAINFKRKAVKFAL